MEVKKKALNPNDEIETEIQVVEIEEESIDLVIQQIENSTNKKKRKRKRKNNKHKYAHPWIWGIQYSTTLYPEKSVLICFGRIYQEIYDDHESSISSWFFPL